MLGEITEELRQQYKDCRLFPGIINQLLLDALRDQLAARIRAEFECDLAKAWPLGAPDGLDPRQKYDNAAWRAEADKQLKGD